MHLLLTASPPELWRGEESLTLPALSCPCMNHSITACPQLLTNKCSPPYCYPPTHFLPQFVPKLLLVWLDGSLAQAITCTKEETILQGNSRLAVFFFLLIGNSSIFSSPSSDTYSYSSFTGFVLSSFRFCNDPNTPGLGCVFTPFELFRQRILDQKGQHELGYVDQTISCVITLSYLQ